MGLQKYPFFTTAAHNNHIESDMNNPYRTKQQAETFDSSDSSDDEVLATMVIPP
jgi:hypothetical protein